MPGVAVVALGTPFVRAVLAMPVFLLVAGAAIHRPRPLGVLVLLVDHIGVTIQSREVLPAVDRAFIIFDRELKVAFPAACSMAFDAIFGGIDRRGFAFGCPGVANRQHNENHGDHHGAMGHGVE
jgi:hypothetical protein